MSAFGGPSVLHLQEAQRPKPRAHEVLVRVHATSVNPIDCSIRRGEQAVSLPAILGCDVSGVIETAGDEVEDFVRGDPVYYMAEACSPNGSYAEYHVAPATIVAHKPANLSHVEAAGIPVAAGTAWDALITRAGLRVGETVLVHGDGDVACFAVQIARAAGALSVLAGTRSIVPLGAQLGASRTVDLDRENLGAVIWNESRDGLVDLVLDSQEGRALRGSVGVLKLHGRLVSTVPPSGDGSDEAITRNITHHWVRIQPDRARLDALRTLLEREQIVPIVDSVFPLRAAAIAHQRAEEGGARGKLVLQILDDG